LGHAWSSLRCEGGGALEGVFGWHFSVQCVGCGPQQWTERCHKQPTSGTFRSTASGRPPGKGPKGATAASSPQRAHRASATANRNPDELTFLTTSADTTKPWPHCLASGSSPTDGHQIALPAARHGTALYDQHGQIGVFIGWDTPTCPNDLHPSRPGRPSDRPVSQLEEAHESMLLALYGIPPELSGSDSRLPFRREWSPARGQQSRAGRPVPGCPPPDSRPGWPSARADSGVRVIEPRASRCRPKPGTVVCGVHARARRGRLAAQ
jgi:hypothetical protein